MPEVSKKRKIEENQQQQQPACHPSLWYEDGNVIIIADSTLFRVHQSMLSRRSPVFKALISLADRSDDERVNSKDACLKITIDDAKEDVERLIPSLYNSECTSAPVVSFLTVSTWLRLGTKYQIEHLRSDAIRRLKVCYPNTLSAFQDTIGDFDRPIAEFDDTEKYAEEFLVSHLALQYDISSIIPVALYLCTTKYMSEDVIPNMDITMREFGTGIVRRDLEFLTRIFSANDTLLVETAEIRYSPLSEGVCNQRDCRSAFLQLPSKGLARHGILYNSVFAPLGPAGLLNEGHISGLCQGCRMKLRARAEAKQEEMWATLPALFKVELSETEWPALMESEDAPDRGGSQASATVASS